MIKPSVSMKSPSRPPVAVATVQFPETRLLTELVGRREGGGQAVVLDDGAAPLGVAHRPHVGHAQRVAGRGPAEVLETRGSQRVHIGSTSVPSDLRFPNMFYVA